jgi:hypothetical protein
MSRNPWKGPPSPPLPEWALPLFDPTHRPHEAFFRRLIAWGMSRSSR